MNASMAVSFLIEEGDKVLIVEEAKPEIFGKWDFPGGSVEQGETLEQAVARELMEEVGLEAQQVKLIRIYEGIRVDGTLGVRFQFKVKLKQQQEQAKLHDDISATRFVTKNELQELVDQHKVRTGIFHLTEICGYLNGYPNYVEIVGLNFDLVCPCGSDKVYKNCHFEP